jgi:hypothetical protein
MDTAPIQALLVRYCDLMDAGDFDGVGELFEDGVLLGPREDELARGATAVADFYRRTVKLYEGSPRTKHLVLNTVFEAVTNDDATAHSSYLVLQGIDELRPIITGRYEDRFVREDVTWRFSARRFFVDLAGDLSQHLNL